ncbi:MAG: hypothetical protein JW797_09195 [Bradymonadales bacterium]|nr:hypothetical protein [Bradymonadales bacterium]
MDRHTLWPFLLLFALSAGFLGCSDEPTTTPAEDLAQCEAGTLCPCTSPFDCPPGETCLNQQCVPLGGDMTDAGEPADLPVEVVDLPDLEPDPDLIEDLEPDPDLVDDTADLELIDQPEEEELPSCIDDNYDQPVHRYGNDTCNRAIPLTTGNNSGLVLCPDDPEPGQSYDYWSYLASEHQEVIFFVQTIGTVASTLYDTSCTSPPIDEAEPVEGGYLASAMTCGQETFKLMVDGAVSERTEYAIEITSSRLPCNDDGFEPSSDSRDTAPMIELATDVDLVFCDVGGEQDWLRFEVQDRGFVADIRATYDAEAICNDLTLTLWQDGLTGARQTSTVTDSGAAIHTTPLEPGGYAIQVTNGEAGEGPYRLRVDLAEVTNCTAFDTYHEPDNSEAQALAPGMPITFDGSGNLANPEQFANLVMCEDDEVDLFAVAMTAASLVELEIETSRLDDPPRVWFYPQGEQPDASHRIDPVEGRFFLSHFSPTAGTWFLRVEPGYRFSRNYYSLDARRSLCTFDRFELNNTADSAYRFGAVTVNETGIGLCATDDTIDWYARPTASYRDQQIRVDNQPGQPLDVSLYFAPYAPKNRHCITHLECEEGETCLGARGCALPLLSDTVLTSSFVELSYWTDGLGGEYLMSVEATGSDVGGGYGFRWTDSFTCPDDSFGNNHSIPTAYAIPLPTEGPLVGDLCVNVTTVKDKDYFTVSVPAQTQLQVSLFFLPGDQVELQLPCSGTTQSSSSGMLSTSTRVGDSATDVCFMVRGVTAQTGRSVIPYNLLLTTSGIEETCQDDSFESNDSIGEASPVNGGLPWVDAALSVGEDLTICGSDADYFEVRAVAGDMVMADALFGASAGDLDLELRGPCQEGVCLELLAQAIGTSDDASLRHTVDENGSYVIGVLAEGSDLNQVYGLNVGMASTCNPSADPYEPNDTPDDAVLDGPSDSPESLALCSKGSSQPDLDWFRYDLLVDDLITIDAAFSHYHGNLDLALWHGDQLVASSSSTDDSEQIELLIDDPGSYYLEVFATDGQDNPYTLSVSIDRSECPDDRMEPNDSWEDATPIASGIYDDLVLCPLAEDWLAIAVPSPSHLAVTMLSTPLFPEEDIQLELYDLSDMPGGSPLFVSGIDRDLDTIEVEIGSDGLGTYLARVFQPEGAPLWAAAPYLLEVRRGLPSSCPRDRYEPNDTSLQAVRLSPSGSIAAFACDDDWYVVHLFAGQTLQVRMDYAVAGGTKPSAAIYLDPEGEPVAGPGEYYIYHQSNETGPVYLNVSPQDSQRAYRLTLTTDAAAEVCTLDDPTEDDDTIATATPYLAPLTGYLCDEVDYFSLTPTSGQDLLVQLTHPPIDPPPLLDIVNGGEVLVGSATPVNASLLAGWFTWLSTGSAYLRLGDPSDEVNAPYLLEVEAFGPVATDALEPNDTYSSPHSLLPANVGVLLSNLSLSHQSDLDFYRFTGNAGRRVGAQIAIEEGGDAILRLYDPAGILLMESNRSEPGRLKEAVWATAATTGPYTIQVAGPTPAPARYSLRALDQADPVCTDSGSNRSYASAEVIYVGTNTTKEVCTGPGDWYRTDQTLVADQSISISVAHDLRHADLDLEIYEASESILMETHTLSSPETLVYTATGTSRVTFRVYIDDGGATAQYQLAIAWE